MRFSIQDLENFIKFKRGNTVVVPNKRSWWFIASSWFWVGCIPFAPGTFGSIAAYPIYYFIVAGSTSIREVRDSLIFVIAVLMLVAYFAINTFHRKTRSIDHRSIVIDEIIGQLTAIAICFPELYEIAKIIHSALSANLLIFYTFGIALATFRFFDITKIFYIRTIEALCPNTFGVIADDILAGVYAGVAIQIIFMIYNYIM